MLAASSAELAVVPDPRTPLGATQLTVDVAGREVIRMPAIVVSLAVQGPTVGAVTGSAGVTQWLSWNTGAPSVPRFVAHDDGRSRSRGRRNVNGVSCTRPENAFGRAGSAAPCSSDTCNRVPPAIICSSVGSGAPATTGSSSDSRPASRSTWRMASGGT